MKEQKHKDNHYIKDDEYRCPFEEMADDPRYLYVHVSVFYEWGLRDDRDYDFLYDSKWHNACKPMETIDMIMRKENALAIINGEKRMEFRQIYDDNFSLLNDEETYTWMMDPRRDDTMDTEAMDEFLSSIRLVMTIHFHDEENSWFLDVECTKNDLTWVFLREVEYLHK